VGTARQKNGNARSDHQPGLLPARGLSTNKPKAVAGLSGGVGREQIQSLAYQIYLARRGTGRAGDATSDWLQAERELKSPAPEPSGVSAVDVRARARGDVLLAIGE